MNEAVFNKIYEMCSPTRRTRRLFERLERAEIKKLDDYLRGHPDVKKVLLTPAKDLKATEYGHLIPVVTKNVEDKTLYDLMKASMEQDYGYIKSYFSVDENGSIGGFVALVMSGNEVGDIKMFSFDLKKFNVTLARDLTNLIPPLLAKYAAVNWSAVKENPIVKAYEKIAYSYGGKVMPYVDPDSGVECIRYRIEGKQP